MKELSDDLIQKILKTEKESEFAKIVIGEKVPFDLWRSNPKIKEHFEKIKYKAEYPYEHNIGYLRKKNQ